VNQAARLTRRTALGGLLAAPAVRAKAEDAPTLRQDLAAMLMLGWSGHTAQSSTARALAGHISAGRVGAVVFVKENVGSRQEVQSLVGQFTETAAPLIAIDHEGGSVQRLTERHEVARLPAARSVAESLTPRQAQALYAEAGSQIACLGFNLNLAPVVDLHDPANPQIGHYGRAFDTHPDRVRTYAQACVDGFALAGVLCALKHFPGDGHAHADSHLGLPDGSAIWTERDVEPFTQLIRAGRARLVMAGHVRIAVLEPRPIPVSLSKAVMTDLLRDRLGYTGVAMTDDLDMQAVSSVMSRRQAVISAIAAGNDLLMIRNANDFDPDLPENVVAWVRDAVAAGELSRGRIALAADRVRQLRGAASSLGNGSG
jgi:beta-N-acetylhexosaminidase